MQYLSEPCHNFVTPDRLGLKPIDAAIATCHYGSMQKRSRRTPGAAHSPSSDQPAAQAAEMPGSWQALLDDAVETPGIVASAYNAFHSYSLGNMVLAYSQCILRGIEIGPIATFKKWQELGRSVRKGERAIQLCRPASTFKRTVTDVATGEETTIVGVTRFVYPRAWFVMAQTDGPDVPAFTPAGDWTVEQALSGLEIRQETYRHPNGYVQGYSGKDDTMAVSPMAFNPTKTAIHEMAHVILHHRGERPDDHRLVEVEAEAVALLVLAALNLPGIDHARGYIQHWNQGSQKLNEETCRRIFGAADKILTAGRGGTPQVWAR